MRPLCLEIQRSLLKLQLARPCQQLLNMLTLLFLYWNHAGIKFHDVKLIFRIAIQTHVDCRWCLLPCVVFIPCLQSQQDLLTVSRVSLRSTKAVAQTCLERNWVSEEDTSQLWANHMLTHSHRHCFVFLFQVPISREYHPDYYTLTFSAFARSVVISLLLPLLHVPSLLHSLMVMLLLLLQRSFSGDNSLLCLNSL